MRRSALRRAIAKRLYPAALSVSLALVWAIAVLGQDSPAPRGGDRPDAVGPDPRLPGAVTKAPDWIETDTPFDVAGYFAAVPRDRNAAPLYLDAFFEFGTEVDACFPAGPGRDRRRQAAADRMKRYMEVYNALRDDPKGVRAETIDAVIALYETGFRKLAEAQRRDRCVFETGLGVEAPIFHVQSARQVVRVASLRVRCAIERQDFDAAIRDVAMVLRLVRDLRPRGGMINQLVAAAIAQVACADMVKPILADPGLRVEHCDRLLRVLLDHEESTSDGYAEGLRAEYLTARVELRDLARKQPQIAAQTSPADMARVVRDINHYYRALLDLDGLPYAGRLSKISKLRISKGVTPLSGWVTSTGPPVQSFSQATGRVLTTLRATECMIVMRRWHVTHRGLPRVLTVAAKEAGLKAVPIDPYDGKPMRVGVFEGQTVVYSVGVDGRDDGGQKDSKFDLRPGDLLHRVPIVEERR